ncbi:unnamed protein product [Schistosoma intercalatum]|nr:unnamed protein product [Schistosoma intercalatum]CAH8507645.1 unnamed protein product [Schistosoma intercalatum]
MAPVTLQMYLQDVNNCINNRNGRGLSHYLMCSDPHVYNSRLAVPDPENIAVSYLVSPWDEIVSAHVRCIWAMRNRDFEEAYACQIVLVKTVAKALSELKDDNWILPVVHVAAIDLRRFAHGLDSRFTPQSDSFRNQGRRMENAAQLILRLFQICASDSRAQVEDSKKLGMMGLANQLFKIYFQINKLNLCKSMIRAIDNLSMNDHFSLAQRVTYCYYVGRKAMFDGDFVSADKSLTFAFERCLTTKWNNKRLILIYLIPVKMLLGVLPKESLLCKYNLKQFQDIADSVKTGNLRKMDSALEEHEAFFLSCGVYLILEKLKLTVYRSLFKRVCHIMKTHLLPIEVFTAALHLMGVEDIDPDETECILANLIHEGKIKGYLAHQQHKLVVSKLQPFPPLTSSMASSLK